MSIDTLGKIAVLMGGTSAERKVSLRSGTAVADALESVGGNVVRVDIQGHAISQLTELDFDVAFIALHGVGSCAAIQIIFVRHLSMASADAITPLPV